VNLGLQPRDFIGQRAAAFWNASWARKRWRGDVDLIARTITVKQQTCYGITTTPKGRTRRTIPMTSTLEHALRRLDVVREGFVVRNLDGSQKTDGQANAVILRICRRAGLPLKRWHTHPGRSGPMRRCSGEPWRLHAWMGHKRIDATMIYVRVAESHRGDIPERGYSPRDRRDRSPTAGSSRCSAVVAVNRAPADQSRTIRAS
jgi:hypothetical protein